MRGRWRGGWRRGVEGGRGAGGGWSSVVKDGCVLVILTFGRSGRGVPEDDRLW